MFTTKAALILLCLDSCAVCCCLTLLTRMLWKRASPTSAVAENGCAPEPWPVTPAADPWAAAAAVPPAVVPMVVPVPPVWSAAPTCELPRVETRRTIQPPAPEPVRYVELLLTRR